MMEFARPYWLLALPLAVLAAWRLSRQLASGQRWRQACEPTLLRYLTQPPGRRLSHALPCLFGVGLTLAIIALAGPGLQRAQQALYKSGEAIVVVLDASQSMQAADLGASRLQLARLKAVELLRRAGDRQMGVVVYAGDAFLLSPITDDSRTLANLLRSVTPAIMPVQGTRLSRALQLAAKVANGPGLTAAHIVVFSDSAEPAAVQLAQDLASARLTISAIGVGTEAGAPIPQPERGFIVDAAGDIVLSRLAQTQLQALASAGGGRYARLSPDDRDLDSILAATTTDRSGTAGAANRATRFSDMGHWLILVLVPLAALGFRRGWILCALVVLGSPQPVSALDWAELWQRRDQLSETARQQGRYDLAVRYADTDWQRGAAHYRAGEYLEAMTSFGNRADATSLYNLATTQAIAGKLKAAVQTYNRALALRPGHPDAIHNRAIVIDVINANRGTRTGAQGAPDGGPAGAGSNAAGANGQAGTDGNQSPRRAPDASSGAATRTGTPAAEQFGQQGLPSAPSNTSSGDTGEAGANPKAQTAATTNEPGQPKQTPSTRTTAAPRTTRHPPSAAEQRDLNALMNTVPDDPGGLLRRKFALQYEQRTDRPGPGALAW